MSTITPLPTPPSRQDPANFSNRADDFLGALPLFATEANLVAGEVNANAATATTQAGTATAQAVIAATQAGIATTQAGIATTKANEAIVAKNEAAALTENYQGSLNEDPLLNKEGGPLTPGDWYVNSSTGFIRAYNGSNWVQGISDVAGVTSINSNDGILTSKDVVPNLFGNAGRVLKVNPSATDVEWGIGVAEGYQEFTTSGIWTKPAEATWVYVEVIGGGDGGRGGFAHVATGASSASLAAIPGNGTPLVASAKLIRASDLPNSVPVVVGAGGAGGQGQIVDIFYGGTGQPRPATIGTSGGVSHFLSADYLNSTHAAQEHVVEIGYPQAAGGNGNASAQNSSTGDGGYNAVGGDDGVRDDTTKSVVTGGAAEKGTYTLGGTVAITATNGVDGPAYCGGAGGGSAACQGLPATFSDTFVTVKGGDGGNGGIASPGGHGGHACTAIYTINGTRTNSRIIAQGGDGGDGGNGIVRVWWW